MSEGNLHANGHPGIQVIPLARALAEQGGRSGRDLLAVFVVGHEVSVRIRRASATRLAVHLDLERVPDVAALAGDAGC